MIDTVEKDMRKAAMAGLVSAGYRLVEHIVADVMPGFGHPRSTAARTERAGG